jgi:hypothetical protein
VSEPVPPIEPQSPVPSIRTVGRDRTGDGFGASATTPPRVEGVPAPSSDSWRTGINWAQIGCGQSRNWRLCPSQSDLDDEKGGTSDAFGDRVVTVPFWAYTRFDCDFSNTDDEFKAWARQSIEALTAAAMGRALWLGEGLPPDDDPLGLDRPLSFRAAGQEVAPGPYALHEAVGVLLQFYEQQSGGAGGAVFHIPTSLMPMALGLGVEGTMARQEGQVYRGPLGSLVSPGPGYPDDDSIEGPDGFGPSVAFDDPDWEYAGNAADERWVFISGPVEYALGPIEVLPEEPLGAELRQNLRMMLAERPGLVRFDPCLVGATKVFAPLTVETS